ncbi:hypothetical protein HYV91_02570 [Candidatus Wolfebacteria bacterium]|nr:hypothetical protein [Candidatus Wolfebacteria bacterium]
MSKFFRKIFYAAVVSFLPIFFIRLKVFATEVGGTSGQTYTLQDPLGNQNILTIIGRVIDYLIYISVPLLALFILWGGFQILGARGDVEKVKNGRATIQWAVIGFTIILVSKGVALILLRILYPSSP